MDASEYQKLAGRTECDQEAAALRMHLGCPASIRLDHAITGLFSKYAEIAGMIERWVWYNQPLDMVNLEEELGDCLWYLALACSAVGLDMASVMEKNIEKLKVRFPNKFTEKEAAEGWRDRKAERRVLERANHLDGKVVLELEPMELQALIDSLEFTATNSGCVSDAHIALAKKSGLKTTGINREGLATKEQHRKAVANAKAALGKFFPPKSTPEGTEDFLDKECEDREV